MCYQRVPMLLDVVEREQAPDVAASYLGVVQQQLNEVSSVVQSILTTKQQATIFTRSASKSKSTSTRRVHACSMLLSA